MRKFTALFLTIACVFLYGAGEPSIDVEEEAVRRTSAKSVHELVRDFGVRKIDYSKPMVALTFDDGPTRIYTNSILNVLKENNAAATFFVVGERIKWYESTIQRIHDEGHELANHSRGHPNLTELSREQVFIQIDETNEAISKVTGFTPKLVRPPYGETNSVVDSVIDSLGMQCILWDVDPQDWLKKDVQKIYQFVIDEVEDGSIVLMHDTNEVTVEAVKLIVPKLIEDGYQLVTVSEMQEQRLLRLTVEYYTVLGKASNIVRGLFLGRG